MKYKEKVQMMKELWNKMDIVYKKCDELNIALLDSSAEKQEFLKLKEEYDSLSHVAVEDKVCFNCEYCGLREFRQFCSLAAKNIPLDIAIKGCECFKDKDFIPC
jgi:hypothetical protein